MGKRKEKDRDIYEFNDALTDRERDLGKRGDGNSKSQNDRHGGRVCVTDLLIHMILLTDSNPNPNPVHLLLHMKSEKDMIKLIILKVIRILAQVFTDFSPFPL